MTPKAEIAALVERHLRARADQYDKSVIGLTAPQAMFGVKMAAILREEADTLAALSAANPVPVDASGELQAIIDAWEALPGDRRYSPKVVEAWMLHHMAPAIQRARAALQPAPTPKESDDYND